MAAEGTSGEKFTRAERAWLLVAALSALVAGVGIMIDADRWAVDGLGQLLAYSGIILVMGWLIARGTRLQIVYPVVGVLISGFIFRDVPSGGVSADELGKMVFAVCFGVAVAGIIELRDRRKKRRQPS